MSANIEVQGQSFGVVSHKNVTFEINDQGILLVYSDFQSYQVAPLEAAYKEWERVVTHDE